MFFQSKAGQINNSYESHHNFMFQTRSRRVFWVEIRKSEDHHIIQHILISLDARFHYKPTTFCSCTTNSVQNRNVKVINKFKILELV